MRLGYIIVYVADVPATVAFWERAFGLACRFRHEDKYAEMETGATALAFADEVFVQSSGVTFAANRQGSSAAGMEIGLVSADVVGQFKIAVEAGCVAVVAPMQKPWGQTVSYVRDCNGVLVEICSPIAG